MAELQHSDVAPSLMDELPPLIAYYFAGAPSWVVAVEIASFAAAYCDVAHELLSAADSSVPAAAAAADFVMDSDLRSSHAHDVSLFYYLEQRHLQLLMALVRLAQLE